MRMLLQEAAGEVTVTVAERPGGGYRWFVHERPGDVEVVDTVAHLSAWDYGDEDYFVRALARGQAVAAEWEEARGRSHRLHVERVAA